MHVGSLFLECDLNLMELHVAYKGDFRGIEGGDVLVSWQEDSELSGNHKRGLQCASDLSSSPERQFPGGRLRCLQAGS